MCRERNAYRELDAFIWIPYGTRHNELLSIGNDNGCEELRNKSQQEQRKLMRGLSFDFDKTRATTGTHGLPTWSVSVFRSNGCVVSRKQRKCWEDYIDITTLGQKQRGLQET